MSETETVFVGEGQILNVDQNFGNIDFSGQDQFISADITNDVVFNIDQNILNNKLGVFDVDWSNNIINFDLNEIKSMIVDNSHIYSLGSIANVNVLYKNYVQNTFFRPETLYHDEEWINNYDTTFNNTNLLNLISTCESGGYSLNNVNSLFQLWRNSSYSDPEYTNDMGFVPGHFIYFPNGISLNYTTDFTDNTAQSQVGTISYYNNYNVVFKVI